MASYVFYNTVKIFKKVINMNVLFKADLFQSVQIIKQWLFCKIKLPTSCWPYMVKKT